MLCSTMVASFLPATLAHQMSAASMLALVMNWNLDHVLSGYTACHDLDMPFRQHVLAMPARCRPSEKC